MTATTRRRSRVGLAALAAALFSLAAALAGGAVFAPQFTEKVIGQAKVVVQQLTAPEVAAITLSGEGGAYELDTAAHGDFVEMVAYRLDGVSPVYAAHNNRGGDVILGWSIGQRVSVTDAASGDSVEYIVADERITPKRGDADQLVGLRGDIALQSCFYGEERMRFVGLEPVA